MMNIHRDAAVRVPRSQPRRRNGPVRLARVSPAVRETALLLAGGDASRLKVLDANTILITNRGRR